jgi:enolase-phosphatase E1
VVEAILLDVEGTTTPVDFVHRTLFAYVREHVESFLREHAGDARVQADVERLRAEHTGDVGRGENPPAWDDGSTETVFAYVHWLMDRDRKSTGLKSLQGQIWERGYAVGELRGEVYVDVPAAFARWREAARTIAIFSSGSVLAQQLLFRHSTAGDLTPYLSAFFDTSTGPKREPESYRRIAASLGVPADRLLFVSDVAEELDAAQLVGVATVLCVRAGEAPASIHAVVESLDAIRL